MKIPYPLNLGFVVHIAAISAVVLFSNPASAQIISVNFQGADPNPLAPSDSTGVALADNWNNIIPSSGTSVTPPFVDSTPTNTSLVLSYTSTYGNDIGGNPGTSTPFNNLYAYHLESPYVVNDSDTFAQAASAGRVTLSLTSIPYATYDLYVYVANSPGYIYESTSASTVINTANKLQYTASNPGTFSAGNNYVEFTGLTGPSQYLYVGFPSAADAAGLNSGIAGFQIVNDPVSAVPEPSAYVLTLAGIGMLVVFSRRRQIGKS